jgi:hypothetical protein
MSHEQPTLSIRGDSGAEYNFTLYPWRQPFSPFGAVYAVLRHDGTSQYSILYLGETADMDQRFDDHHKQRCFDRRGHTHIGVLPEPAPARRQAIAAELIRIHNPPCNGD